jgi:hypothetical protein
MAYLVLDNPVLPESVYCTGGRYFFDDNHDITDYQMVTFGFGNYVLNAQAGVCTPYMVKSNPEIRFGEGYPDWKQNATNIQIMRTKRMMYVGRMGGGWQVLDKDGKIVAQQSGIYPLKSHLQNFVDCYPYTK